MDKATMTTNVPTNTLIDILCDDLPEKQKFRHPASYFFCWLVVSVVAVVTYLNLFLSIRFDILHRLTDPAFIISTGAMLLGSCFYAYSALTNAIPGTKNHYDRLGFVAMLIWMSVIVFTMIFNVESLVAGKLFLRFEFELLAHIFIAGFIPMILLWGFIQRLAPVKPKRIALSACLASFMMSIAMMRFFYIHLFNGADCGYSLFLWIMIPFVLSTLVGWKITHKQFVMKSVSTAEFLNSIDQRNAPSFILSRSL